MIIFSQFNFILWSTFWHSKVCCSVVWKNI